MQRDWNEVADSYDESVFDVLAHDRKGLIEASLRKYGREAKTATDVGCGIGKCVALMAENFPRVEALDLSAKCLDRARKAHARLDNVGFAVADLADPGVKLPKSDLALCVNVLLTPSLTHRTRMLDALCGHLRRKGHLVLVVPSLESALLSNARLIEWNVRSGISPARADVAGFPTRNEPDYRKLHAGVLRLGGADTKHFLKEEVQLLLGERGLQVLEMHKLEYPWATEFDEPPAWMQEPCPWDWLCVARMG